MINIKLNISQNMGRIMAGNLELFLSEVHYVQIIQVLKELMSNPFEIYIYLFSS